MAQTVKTTKVKDQTAAKPAVTHKLVKASARFIQVSPQKMRLVADMVRATPVDVALEQLRFSSKKAALPLAKLINSAVANAIHNFNLDKNSLFIKVLTVDGGPVLDRYKPRAYGSPSAIQKRSSHINIILEERLRTGKKSTRSIFAGIRPGKSVRAKDHKHDHDGEDAKGKVDNNDNKPTHHGPKSEEKSKGSKISLKRRLFNRKSGE